MTTIRVERDLTMTTRDGVTLGADVYLPDGDGPFPTLLYRVRGSKSSAFIAGAIMLNPIVAAERGYAVVLQEVRGRGSSGGDFHPFITEKDDGWDALEWVTAQPWCNGRVGSYGTAYTGIDALLMAATGHPALEAVAAVVSGVSPHDGWIYTGGAFELGWNNFWAHLLAGESFKRLDADTSNKARIMAGLQSAMSDPWEPMERYPLTRQPQLDEVSPFYQDWIAHSSYDDYWRAVDVIAAADRITAKILNITGWWDNFQHSHLDLYRALSEHSPSGHHQRLILGPWDHFTYVNIVPTKAGTENFGPAGVAGPVVTEPAVLAWMDRWLKDVPETDETAPVTKWFASGAHEWRTAQSWPPPHTSRTLHLRAGGRLSDETPQDEQPDTYRFDPADPTPTKHGRTLMPSVVEAGIGDMAPVAARDDVLTYDTAMLVDPVEIAGNVRFEGWVATSAADADVSAVLVDVHPDGRRMLVADGYVRLRHRHGLDHHNPVTPRDPVHVVVDLWDVAWTFAEGHRIGLHLASASFPRFDVNLGTGRPPGDGTLADAVVAEQIVFHDTDRPSAIVLPILH